jgi:hypothetical protein
MWCAACAKLEVAAAPKPAASTTAIAAISVFRLLICATPVVALHQSRLVVILRAPAKVEEVELLRDQEKSPEEFLLLNAVRARRPFGALDVIAGDLPLRISARSPTLAPSVILGAFCPKNLSSGREGIPLDKILAFARN